MDEQIMKLKEYMDASRFTVAITGAGISYRYGMRLFKQKAGRDWMGMVAPDYIKAHPEEIYALFKDAFLDAIFEKGPGPVHHQLAELEKMGKLQGIVTQNLDCLHDLAGSKNTVAFMGSFADTICLDCGARLDDVDIWNHGGMPCCPQCGGITVPVYFYRIGGGPAAALNVPNEWMARAQDMIARAELLLVIGTTGFHSDEYMAKADPSAKLVQINHSSTMFDSRAVLNVRMDAEKVFEQILAAEKQ